MTKAEPQSLSEGWRERLAALEPALELGPLTWQTRLEAKVLRFLVARYPDERGVTSANAPRPFVSMLAFIASPSVRPAKRQRMQLLRHIAQVNQSVREKKLSHTERFLQDFDRKLEAQGFKAHVRHVQKQRQQEQRDRTRLN